MAKTLLKTLQTLKGRPQFPFSYSGTKITPPHKQNPQESHLDSHQPTVRKMEALASSCTRGSPGALEWARQKPQRQVLFAHMAHPHGVPNYPGSLKVSGIHLPTLGHWKGWWQWPGKGDVGCMALQAPDLRTSSPYMVPDLQSCQVSLFWMDNWFKSENRGHQAQTCGLGRDISEESSFEEMVSRLPWSAYFEKCRPC